MKNILLFLSALTLSGCGSVPYAFLDTSPNVINRTELNNNSELLEISNYSEILKSTKDSDYLTVSFNCVQNLKTDFVSISSSIHPSNPNFREEQPYSKVKATYLSKHLNHELNYMYSGDNLLALLNIEMLLNGLEEQDLLLWSMEENYNILINGNQEKFYKSVNRDRKEFVKIMKTCLEANKKSQEKITEEVRATKKDLNVLI